MNTLKFVSAKMVKKMLKRRDQGGLPQPDRASLLASAGGARDTHATRETMAAGASFFAFLSHIIYYSTKGAFHYQELRYVSGGMAVAGTHNERCTYKHCCKLGGADAQRTTCPATQM